MEALGVKHHELRAWLALEPLASRSTRARSATTYTPVDLLFLAVVKCLDDSGIKLEALRSFSKALHKQLQQPVTEDNDVLELHGDGTEALQLGSAPAGAATPVHLSLSLGPIRKGLMRFRGADKISGQRELNLPQVLHSASTRRRA